MFRSLGNLVHLVISLPLSTAPKYKGLWQLLTHFSIFKGQALVRPSVGNGLTATGLN